MPNAHEIAPKKFVGTNQNKPEKNYCFSKNAVIKNKRSYGKIENFVLQHLGNNTKFEKPENVEKPHINSFVTRGY